MKEFQIIGLDIGRGYVKGYTEFNGQEKSCLFKSIVSLARSIDLKDYKDPIYLEVKSEGYFEEYFAGILAEVEGHNPIQNLKDDKTTPTVEKLIYAALNKLALCDEVKIMLGVPNKMFNKQTRQNVRDFYKNKTVFIKDKTTNSRKTVRIADIEIFREGDAALLCHVDKHGLSSNDIGMVTIGFRTTEFSYYDKNLTYIDLKSDTIENGNKNILEYIQKRLKDEGTMRTLAEIDSSDRYDDLKEMGYRNLVESTEQDIEKMWKNGNEVDVFIAGGTSLNMDFKKYPVIEDAQMITSKGLFLVGTERF